MKDNDCYNRICYEEYYNEDCSMKPSKQSIMKPNLLRNLKKKFAKVILTNIIFKKNTLNYIINIKIKSLNMS